MVSCQPPHLGPQPLFIIIYHPSIIISISISQLTMADPNSLPLTRSSVIAAHDLIKPYIHHTPVLTNTYFNGLACTPRTTNELAGTSWAGQEPASPKVRLWFKCENLQKIGAFKARGAFHALIRLMQTEGWEENRGRERGVVTHSSGIFFIQI